MGQRRPDTGSKFKFDIINKYHNEPIEEEKGKTQ